MTLSANKIFVLAAVIIWLVVAIIGFVDRPIEHELEWVAVGLASLGISFLV